MKLKPTSMIKAELGIQPKGPVHAYFTDRCKVHMEKYIPYSGDDNNVIHLRENTEQGIDYIEYQTDYAHAQYVGYTTGPVVNYTTPRNWAILGQSNVDSRRNRSNKRSTGVYK